MKDDIPHPSAPPFCDAIDTEGEEEEWQGSARVRYRIVPVLAQIRMVARHRPLRARILATVVLSGFLLVWFLSVRSCERANRRDEDGNPHIRCAVYVMWPLLLGCWCMLIVGMLWLEGRFPFTIDTRGLGPYLCLWLILFLLWILVLVTSVDKSASNNNDDDKRGEKESIDEKESSGYRHFHACAPHCQVVLLAPVIGLAAAFSSLLLGAVFLTMIRGWNNIVHSTLSNEVSVSIPSQ